MAVFYLFKLCNQRYNIFIYFDYRVNIMNDFYWPSS